MMANIMAEYIIPKGYAGAIIMDSNTVRSASITIRDDILAGNDLTRRLLRHTIQGVCASMANWLRTIVESNIAEWEHRQVNGELVIPLRSRLSAVRHEIGY